MLLEAYTIALAETLNPTDDYHYRWVCREYSKRFNTPLPEVYAMGIVDVAVNVYEDMLQESEEEDLIEKAYKIAYPADDESTLNDFIEKALEEEELRQAKKLAASSRKAAESFPEGPRQSLGRTPHGEPLGQARAVSRRYEGQHEDELEAGDLDGLESLAEGFDEE